MRYTCIYDVDWQDCYIATYHVNDLSKSNSEFDDNGLWCVEHRSWRSVIVIQQVAY